MYFWKDLQLAQKLHHNEVTKKQLYIYFAIFLLATTVWTYSCTLDILNYIQSGQNISQFLYAIFYTCFYILTYSICFYMNKKGDDKNFINRLICLSCPIEIKNGIIFGLIIAIVMWTEIFLPVISGDQSREMLWDQMQNHQDEISPQLMYIPMVASNIFVLWRYILAFRITAGSIVENKELPAT